MFISHSISESIVTAKPRSNRLSTWVSQHKKRVAAFVAKRQTVRYGLLLGNALLLGGIIAFVAHGAGSASNSLASPLAATANQTAVSNPLDQLSSADIAANLARATSLPEATAVTNQADTVSAELAITPAGTSLVAKPQVIETTIKSRYDIKDYVVQNGDTVTSVATKFNVTSDSIRRSNGIAGDALTPGNKIVIPPINGIVYTVKSGDTAQTVAAKYNANADQITAFNDAEIGGLRVGERILIPNGQQQTVSTSPYASSSYAGSFLGSAVATYGGNGYDYGYCTWWVANRRIQVGRPLPTNLGDAYTWPTRAAMEGLSTGTKPAAGAAMWFPEAYPGHIAYVESVNDDGSAVISEMNHLGWAVKDTRTIPDASSGAYKYIY